MSSSEISDGTTERPFIFYGLRSKLLNDFKITLMFMKSAALKSVDGFGKAMTIMIGVFFARSIIGGYIVPQAISRIVNALKNEEENVLVFGLGIFTASAIMYAVTEFMLFKYFRMLADAIVTLKKKIVDHIKDNGVSDSPEDVIGRISSDIDFVIWNMNAVLVTLLPNIFTGVVATYTILNFNVQVGLITMLTLAPYLMLAEYYSRRAEVARLEERHEYSVSIACIRDIVYWRQENGFLGQVLNKWYRAILRVIWYDRIYWGLSLFTQYASIGIVAFIALLQAYRGFIDVGSLAGIVSAAINAHTALLNAMWALCIQGQNIAAIKRIYVYLYGVEQSSRGRESTQHSLISTPVSKTHTDSQR
ncbi:MAG: hypothetical protein N3D82_00770 [Ignisphaera sp.]|nr:hypothetical protein [Ignisphaera sp.]